MSKDKDAGRDKALTLVSIQERHKSIRTASVCAAVVLVVAIIAWAVVRIYNHDRWVEIATILFAPTGIVATVLVVLLHNATRKVDAAASKIDEAGKPKDS